MANFTKQAIETAFLQLLNEKPLNKISVRDIVEKCGINRNSLKVIPVFTISEGSKRWNFSIASR